MPASPDRHPAGVRAAPPPGSPWLVRHRRNSSASTRLFCFHCAGGSASEFRGWPALLPGRFEVVAIQLPGREGRVKDAFNASVEDLANEAVDAMVPLLDKPYAIFGHSFGAVCGFEVMRALRRRQLPLPFLFVPAGRRAPQTRKSKPPIAGLPREQFIAELLKDYGDNIRHVLQTPELREVFIPQIHADFALSEAYLFRLERPFDLPIVAFAGVSEDDLDDDDLHAWAAHTERKFHARRFPGDHFFIRGSQALVVEAIAQEISALRREETGFRPHSI